MALAAYLGAGNLRLATALLRQVRIRMDASLTDRAAARAILNIRDDLARRTTGAMNEVEDLVEAIVLIGLRIPEEKQLADILGDSFGD